MTINGPIKDIFTPLRSQWQNYQTMWRSYELVTALIFDQGQWKPYFLYVTGHFEETTESIDPLPASIDGYILLYRIIWTADSFSHFLDETIRDGTFTIDDDIVVTLGTDARGSLTQYADGRNFYDPWDYHEVLSYILCQVGLQGFGNSTVLYTIGALTESRGYHGLEDMMKREFGIRNGSQIFQIILPLGIRVDAILKHEDLTVDVRLHESLSQKGSPIVKVGNNSSSQTNVEMGRGDSDGDWVEYHGNTHVTTPSTSLWISHPAFLASTPESSSLQTFRIDLSRIDSQQPMVNSEKGLVDLLFQNGKFVDGNGLYQLEQWLTQVDNKDSNRASHLEVALETRFVLAGARVYYCGVGLQTPGIDMVAIWADQDQPKALVVSATSKIDMKFATSKIQSLVELKNDYCNALTGYDVIFVLAIPVKLDLLPFSVIIEAARHHMAILGAAELDELRDLNKSFSQIWEFIFQIPGTLHAMVVQEFAEINTFGYGIQGSC